MEEQQAHTQAWRFTLDPWRTRRRVTREVRVGDVGIGGHNPIRLQSMTIADTLDTPAVVAEICALAAAGSDIVRVTAPNRTCAENLATIRAELQRRGVHVPLVADIHFTPQAALIAAQYVEKVRINPGNFADRKLFKKRDYTDAEYNHELERLEKAFAPLVRRCRELGVAMRIGTNHGSLSDRVLNRYGDTPLGMVESALEFVRICELHGYRDLVLSMKASDVKVMVQAYRLLAARLTELGMDYPFHLGVTEAGFGLAARIKSSIGIGALLRDGIGDTIRVSLTEDSVAEIPVARAMVTALDRPGPVWSATLHALPPWSPFRFQRQVARPAPALKLGPPSPPQVEVRLPVAATCDFKRYFESVAQDTEQGPDLVLLAVPSGAPDAALEQALGAARSAGLGGRIGVETTLRNWSQPAAQTLRSRAWARVSLVVDADMAAGDTASTKAGISDAPRQPLQYVLAVNEDASLERALDFTRSIGGAWPEGAIALETPSALMPHVWRRFLAGLGTAPTLPCVLRLPPAASQTAGDVAIRWSELDLAGDVGVLLVDGIGAALQFVDPEDPGRATRLGRELLQAARLRLSQADFIACPSCGRTQFDLQTTTARIQTRFQHLTGVKIAVMGCIVNGPGEMADADFGYVGSGPGRIDLYVGHQRVERNIPEEDAVERLVTLIRQQGRWHEPGTPPPAPEYNPFTISREGG